MITIRYVEPGDRAFWRRLDPHLPEAEFEDKVRTRRGYVLLAGGAPAGLLRYGLFWDSVPFCTMLYVAEEARGGGRGTALVRRWEEDMRRRGHTLVLTSTRADETAQYFYRKLGYRDCGCLLLDTPPYAQPTELFFAKTLG